MVLQPNLATGCIQSLEGLPTSIASLALRICKKQAEAETGVGHWKAADRDLAEALTIARYAHLFEEAASLDVRRARVLIQLDEMDDAKKSLDEAELYSKQQKTPTLRPYIQHYRGLIAAKRSSFEDAITLLKASLEEFRTRGENAMAANVMITLAWSYDRLGKREDARALYEEGGKLSSPTDQHLFVGHLGNLFFEERNFPEAEKCYLKAAKLSERINKSYYAIWLTNLASAQCEQRKWKEADGWNEKALELYSHLDSPFGRAAALINRGRIQTRKGAEEQAKSRTQDSRIRYEAAEATLKLAIKSDEGYQIATLDARCALADLYVRMGRTAEAEAQFKEAVSLADETRRDLREEDNKLSSLSSPINVYQQYVQFLYERDKEKAFLVAESSRAKLLHDQLRVSQPREHTLAEYKAASTASGAIFLEYWIAPQDSYLWLIRGQQFLPFLLPRESQILSLVKCYQAAVQGEKPGECGDQAAGAKLFKMLLEEHDGVLTPGGKYIIVLDGPLHSLNFETLPVGTPKRQRNDGFTAPRASVRGSVVAVRSTSAIPGGNPRGAMNPEEPAKQHYWIEDATVAVTPSLDLLVSAHQSSKAPVPSLLAVGDAIESEGFPKLINAGTEINSIEKQFAAKRRKVLVGAEATPEKYKASEPKRFSFLHFATHAEPNGKSPLDSSLILSKGKLSLSDVLGTPVDAEVVTISACYSAYARTYSGEGLVGFAWAFFLAGARSVIAGLWNVSDYYSPELMKELYAGLLRSEAPADALRSAKLKLLHAPGSKYKEPYYWGAFQLYTGELPTVRQPLMARN